MNDDETTAKQVMHLRQLAADLEKGETRIFVCLIDEGPRVNAMVNGPTKEILNMLAGEAASLIQPIAEQAKLAALLTRPRNPDSDKPN